MHRVACVALCLLTFAVSPATAKKLNGFDISNAAVPTSAILRGGPPRDGIPALFQPRYTAAEQIDFLCSEDRVLGIEVENVSFAYPIKILN